MSFKTTFIIIIVLLFSFTGFSQKQIDSAKTKKKKSEYTALITKKTKTDAGLFKVHFNAEKEAYYFEIPKYLLNKDMLWVTRLVKLPANFGGGYTNAGSKTNEQLVRWEKVNTKIILKTQSYAAVAPSHLPIHASVDANNYEPSIFGFKIKAETPDSTAVLIDVTKFLNSDVKAISGISNSLRKEYKVKKLDASRSIVRSVKSYPKNIEILQDFTYEAANPPSLKRTEALSLQINQSMILLPEHPMQPRIFDERVGFFTESQYNYGSEALKSDKQTFITRWRLVPKDIKAYKKGKLVEPIKPIVYYLDPATPKKLRKYIKQGVEDWQKAFETAGFKNAIIAKDPPSKAEDPEFSPEDVRYSVIRYVASTTRNATGPSVTDPRTGEIIESDIIWYHNHLRSYRNRYLLETGAANPSARTLNTSEDDIGAMMRMVIAHEVGHTLGFPHNMAASFAYSPDKYRNGNFTQKYGIAASIMDYARYNYIAQPGDKNIRFIRQIGPYDHYAVNWGYRYLDKANTPEKERTTLNQWILEKANNPLYRFGKQSSRFDPSSQTEDISNNAVVASTYALKNLKFVAEHLHEWTSEATNNYTDLNELYGELLSCWSRYNGHVINQIGGIYEYLKTPEQEGNVYIPVAKEKQIEALQWVFKNSFTSLEWLANAKILSQINHTGHLERLSKLQERQLNYLLKSDRLQRIINTQWLHKENTLSLTQFMLLVTENIFSNSNPNSLRRNLQKAYIKKLESLYKTTNAKVDNTDIKSVVFGILKELKTHLKSIASATKTTEFHYSQCLQRINTILKENQ